MRQLLIILAIISGHFAYGQNKNCDCPRNDLMASIKPVIIFSFSNDKSIGLCGFVDASTNDTTYSEFILFLCGQKKILNQWDATKNCKILKAKDTLFVQQLFGLAIDKNMDIKWVPFYITKYYFDKSIVKSTAFFRKDLTKYSPTQIKNVITQYKNLTTLNSADDYLLVAHRLFWAYVSGSKEAESYLNSFEKRFGPFDGAVAEEFHDLLATYKLYRS